MPMHKSKIHGGFLKPEWEGRKVEDENFLLLFEDNADKKVEKFETFDEGRICCVKLVFIQVPRRVVESKKKYTISIYRVNLSFLKGNRIT